MRRVSLAAVTVFALMIGGVPIRASEPAASSSAPATKAPAKATAPPATAPSSAPVTPAKKDASATAPPAQTETLEEIVARVRKRLAMEAARGPRPPAPPRPQPPATPRVTLEWRPSVVWPAEIGGEAPPAAAADPSRVSLSWDSQ